MNDRLKSITAMLFSALGFALMGVFIKLTGDIPVMQKVVFRTYIIVITAALMMRHYGVSLKGVRHFKLLILRSALGTVGIILNYYAVDHLLLSDASILFRISTFLLLLFSWIFLGERITLNQFITIIIAFIGVLFIVKPQMNVVLIPYMAALLGAAFAAAAYTVVRALGTKEAPLVVVFFFAAFTSVILTPAALIGFVPMTGLQVLYATLAGLGASMGQVGVTYAYKHAPAKEVSIYGYFGVVFSAILSLFIFDAIPDLWSIIGYLIIFGTAYHMYQLNMDTKKKRFPLNQ